MRAVLYDIHGNLPALEAVIEEAQSLGVESYVLGGDYALFGACPVETVARLLSEALGDVVDTLVRRVEQAAFVN